MHVLLELIVVFLFYIYCELLIPCIGAVNIGGGVVNKRLSRQFVGGGVNNNKDVDQLSTGNK